MPIRIFVFCLLSAVAVVAAPQNQPAPRPGDTVEWYTVVQGDTFEALTQRYLGTRLLWEENQRLNPGVDRLKLYPGLRIRIITKRILPPRSAEVLKVSRIVEETVTPNPWVPTAVGHRLSEKDGLRTFEKSSAQLLFDDGTSLTLTEQSLVFLREFRKTIRGVDRNSIEIVNGQADLKGEKTAKKKRDIELVVAGASLKPGKGEAFSTRGRNDSGTAQVMVYTGASKVAAAGKEVAVKQGMGTSVPQGKPPLPPEKLLPAPIVVAPLSEGAVSASDDLRWKDVPGAASYVVEVCRDDRCTQLADRARGIATPSWSLSALPFGSYFWRVSSVSRTGLDGYASTPRALIVGARISGVVAEDREGALVVDRTMGRPGVRLALYRDDGDRTPGGGDARVAEAVTNRAGEYQFPGLTTGDFWVSIDSRSVTASDAAGDSLWSDQTGGPRGSLCGSSVRETAGPCVGGRRQSSDDYSSLAASRHVALVTISDSSVPDVDFAFSFAVVTNGGNGQGSLRQFLSWANGRREETAMRFIPYAPGVVRIRLDTSLPVMTRPVVIDGRPRSVDDSSTILPGTVPMGHEERVGRSLTPLVPPAPLSLEIDASGLETGLESKARLTLLNVALNGAVTAVRAAELIADDVVFGARLDGEPAPAGQRSGVAVHGDSRIRRALFQDLPGSAIVVEDGRVVAEEVEVSKCATDPAGGSAIVLNGAASLLNHCYVHDSGSEQSPGAAISAMNTERSRVHNCSLMRNSRGLFVSPEASNNIFSYNLIRENRHSGLLLASHESSMTPNQLVENDHLQNGDEVKR